ncbi:uncharacterized protein EV420DRAFT_1478384 [Desarmillaria tabescens]|uniref:Peptidase C14 caspase domain-containing protein n=1 Tax=Armillaria tabescens TaxID=1929756 RepID=A0AA39N7U0_ARMTA|nr:uncharacterized protein EV420DRAFT_1478384 [Desarmillaria tabescens]KAK0460626.1 hypothetical protein EV420DRAFT_1478384 [Desarmillaria tabescens]
MSLKATCIVEGWSPGSMHTFLIVQTVTHHALPVSHCWNFGSVMVDLGFPPYMHMQYCSVDGRVRSLIKDSGSLPLQPRPDSSRIWAALIGIDGYSTYPLDGCVEDALAMADYLVKDLAVPKGRIQLLLGPRNNSNASAEASFIPSRRNILSLLRSLINNDEIKHGDPIIIFAAGHGYRYPVSEDDHDNDSDYGGEENDSDYDTEHDCKSPPKFVEAFCPIDRDTLDSSDDPIPDISDWELNTILSELSRAKGHRITVLLDCCHAGSITRTYSRERAAPPPKYTSLEDMLRAAEEGLTDLLGRQTLFSKDWVPDMDSHVMVAACKENERAQACLRRKEDGTKVWRGVFTSLLIKTLRSGVLKEGATYVHLGKALLRRQLRRRPQTPLQTPNVAGRRQNMRLWYQD